MSVLKIYETSRDIQPVVVFSGAKWIWERNKNIITVWFNDKYFDFTCTVLENKDMVFSAYGEIIPPEETPEEIINW